MPVRIPEPLVPLLRDIDTIAQHPSNPNSGDIEAIAESILTVGYTAPVIVQASTGYIIAGNHRYAAMLSLGQSHIPVIEVQWDDETALRHLLGDNRTSELAHREEAQLLELLKRLTDTDAGLVGTGYTPDDIAKLVEDIEPNPGMFSHLDPTTLYGVMVSCDDEDTAAQVLGILEGMSGVQARAVTL